MFKKIRREAQRIGKQVENESRNAGKKIEKEVRRTRDRVIKEAKRVNVQAEKIMQQVKERMKDPRMKGLLADTTKKLVKGEIDLQSIGLCVSGFIGLGTTKEEIVCNGLGKLMSLVNRGSSSPSPSPSQPQPQQTSPVDQNTDGEVDLDALRDALESLMKSMENDIDDPSNPPEMNQFRQTYRSIINIMTCCMIFFIKFRK